MRARRRSLVIDAHWTPYNSRLELRNSSSCPWHWRRYVTFWDL
jgi:predicted LPLAT superfamily acyltransferase